MKKPLILKIISAVLFLALIYVGYFLAKNKPIWNDEIYSQAYSVKNNDFFEIIQGKVDEGNNCPVFYASQSALCSLLKYKFPTGWEGRWSIYDPRSQIILRVNSILLMSLAILCIFYFFAKEYSLFSGILSLVVSLSTYMVWFYWAEARPYPMWFFFSTLQYLLFLKVSREGKLRRKVFWFFVALHIIMSLTVVLSVIQIFVISILFWAIGERKLKDHALLLVLPAMFSTFYYLRAPKYDFWFDFSPIKLITEAVPLERIVLIIGFSIFVVAGYIKKRSQLSLYDSNISDKNNGKDVLFIFLTLFLLLGGFSLLGLLVLGDSGKDQGFALSSRYFVFLSPLQIIATTLFSIKIFKLFKKNVWMIANIAIILGGLIILRAMKNFIHLYDVGLF